MRKFLIAASALALASLPGYALADGGGAVAGAVGGAATGAVVGGPVGAAVGGVAGAITGAAVTAPSPPVITYVQRQPLPRDTVVVHQEIVVGQPLPPAVEVTPVPDHPQFAYAVVNHERVIVDPRTHVVVKVID